MCKILFVDDEKGIRDLLALTLSVGNFRTFEASNGKEAIAIALKEKPDLIIMDIMMPKMNGLAAAKIIKGNPETKDIKIIVLSSINDVITPKPYVDGYFMKPFSPLNLIKKVEEVLNL